jgi:hypothetical protein
LKYDLYSFGECVLQPKPGGYRNCGFQVDVPEALYGFEFAIRSLLDQLTKSGHSAQNPGQGMMSVMAILRRLRTRQPQRSIGQFA